MLVGTTTNDDAAVYRLSDTEAIVSTIDYFTPIVDDPYWFGAIAAANALSDIYAMGARPLFALNLVGFPRGALSFDVLAEILRGGAAKAADAGIPIIGGHSIDDQEPKYGLAVTGVVAPDKIVRNVGARAGDAIFLTKPIGTGIISTAIKRELADERLIATAVDAMATLNRLAAEAMAVAGPTAATDVTGFGLLGHLREVVAGSGVGARIEASVVPVIDGVFDLARQDVIPGGTRRNREAVDGDVVWSPEIDDATRLVLCDAQTSGGLLIVVPADRADVLADELGRRGTLAARIGEITPRRLIEVVP